MGLITLDILREAKLAWKYIGEQNQNIMCTFRSDEPQYLKYIFINNHWYYSRGLTVYDGHVYLCTLSPELLEDK